MSYLPWSLIVPVSGTEFFSCPDSLANPVVLKGKRFFDSFSGRYFPIKGIAYYPRPNDGPLATEDSVDYFTDDFRFLWEADLEYFKELGINTLRIYAVDPSKNHDSFMCALQKAGIYVMIGLLADCEDCGIGPNEAPSCYPAHVKERGQWIINEFSKYANTLLFSAGNEVTLYAQDRQIELNAPCQKKFLRDMRSYVNTCSAVKNSILPRQVPIGMVNWDSERELQALYFNCRTNPDDELENTEWYGLNAYQHCDPEATTIEDLDGWIQLKDDFASYNLSVPVIIAEYGCRERFDAVGEFEAQRDWLQIDALYSEEYVEVLAGGVVFEYSAEKYKVDLSTQDKPWPYYEFMKLQYGVGYYSPEDCDHDDTICVYNKYPEFDLLSAKLGKVSVSFVPGRDSYTPPTDEVPTCPEGLSPVDDFVWPTDDEPDIPCYVINTPFPTSEPTNAPEIPDNVNGPDGASVQALPSYALFVFAVLLGTYMC